MKVNEARKKYQLAAHMDHPGEWLVFDDQQKELVAHHPSLESKTIQKYVGMAPRFTVVQAPDGVKGLEAD